MSVRDIVIVAAGLVLAVTIAGRCHNATISEWEDRVQRVQRLVEAERARADAKAAAAARESARADSIALAVEARAPVIRERIVRVEAETPDSLRDHPAIVARDSIIVDLQEESEGWKGAYESERRARVNLQTALDLTVTALDSVTAVLDDRPGERPWWMPRLGVGPSAGLCKGWDPCLQKVGAQLSWEVRL